MEELFEKGRSYTFYFGGERAEQPISGQVLSYDPPLVKVETEGLIRIINCSSTYFLEAVARREDEAVSKPTPVE
jgi:hypothetical protein